MTLSALGYPESKSRIYASIADCLLLSVVSREEDEREYHAADSSGPNQIAIHFKRNNMRGANGNIVQAPLIYGMSGGGLFWIHDDGKVGSSPPMLVGILTHWNASEQSTIVATHIGWVDKLLKDNFSISIF